MTHVLMTHRRAELKLEAKESEDIRFSAGLLRACRDERSLFCRGVEPGQARVFRCLAENMGSGDFGDVCRSQIKQKIERRWVREQGDGQQGWATRAYSQASLGVKYRRCWSSYLLLQPLHRPPCTLRLPRVTLSSHASRLHESSSHCAESANVALSTPGNPTGAWTLPCARPARRTSRSSAAQRTRRAQRPLP